MGPSCATEHLLDLFKSIEKEKIHRPSFPRYFLMVDTHCKCFGSSISEVAWNNIEDTPNYMERLRLCIPVSVPPSNQKRYKI